MKYMGQPIIPRFNDDTPEAKAFRLEQAFVDAEIEGIPRNAKDEAFLKDLCEQELSDEEGLARINAYLDAKVDKILAAE